MTAAADWSALPWPVLVGVVLGTIGLITLSTWSMSRRQLRARHALAADPTLRLSPDQADLVVTIGTGRLTAKYGIQADWFFSWGHNKVQWAIPSSRIAGIKRLQCDAENPAIDVSCLVGTDGDPIPGTFSWGLNRYPDADDAMQTLANALGCEYVIENYDDALPEFSKKYSRHLPLIRMALVNWRIAQVGSSILGPLLLLIATSAAMNSEVAPTIFLGLLGAGFCAFGFRSLRRWKRTPPR